MSSSFIVVRVLIELKVGLTKKEREKKKKKKIYNAYSLSSTYLEGFFLWSVETPTIPPFSSN